jgi:hypothetical protein
VFFLFLLAGFVRRDGSGDHRRRSLLRFYLVWVLLSGLLPAAPARMGRASFQAEDDADKPARKAGMGSPGPWQPTTDLTSRVCLFWQNVNASTCQALETHRTVIISSHLLTGIRAAGYWPTPRNMDSLSAAVLSDSFYSLERALMQLEILFRQWRWRTDFRRDFRAGPPAKIFKHGK